jgi:hypothetical protein
LAGLESEQRHLRSNAEAEAPPEAHTFIHVHVSAAVPIKAGRPALGFPPEQDAAEPWPIHLPAVRMSTQDEVCPVIGQQFNRLGIVSQNDPRRFPTLLFQGGNWVGFLAPQVVDPSYHQTLPIAFDSFRPIAQYRHTLGFQCITNCFVQPAMSAETERVANRKIVVAKDRKNAEGCLEVPEKFCRGFDVPVSLVDEITRQGNQVGLFAQRTIECILEIPDGDLITAMKIGELSDSESMKGVR